MALSAAGAPTASSPRLLLSRRFQYIFTPPLTPEPDLVSEREDFFGNPTAFFSMQRGHSRLSVTATSEVEVGSPPRPGQAPDVPWEEAAEVLCHDLDPERLEARQFILDSPLCEAAADVTQYAAMSLRPGGLLLESRGRAQRAHRGRDKLIGADASHAWFAVYHPDLGWFDFDPTNNHCPDDRHITVAWGRDYRDVTPLKGVVYGGGQQQATVSVEVINLMEDNATGPRPPNWEEAFDPRKGTSPALNDPCPSMSSING